MQGEPTEPTGHNPYQVPPPTAEVGGPTLSQTDSATPAPFKPEVSHQTVYGPLEQTEATTPSPAETEDQSEVVADLRRRLDTAGRRIQELMAENQELRAKVEAEPKAEKPKAPEHEMVRDIVKAGEELAGPPIENMATLQRLIDSLEDDVTQLRRDVSPKVEHDQNLDLRVDSSSKTLENYLGSYFRTIRDILAGGREQVGHNKDRIAELAQLFSQYPDANARKAIKSDLDFMVKKTSEAFEYSYGETLKYIDSVLGNIDAELRQAEGFLGDNNNQSTLAYRVFARETEHLKGRVEKFRAQLLTQLTKERTHYTRSAKKVDDELDKLLKAYPGEEVQA